MPRIVWYNGNREHDRGLGEKGGGGGTVRGSRDRRRPRQMAAAAAVVAGLLGTAGACGDGTAQSAQPSVPQYAEAEYESSTFIGFDDLRGLVAASLVVVVGRAGSYHLGDEVEGVSARVTELDVDQVLRGHVAEDAVMLAECCVAPDGTGRQSAALPWLQPGDAGVFFLTEDTSSTEDRPVFTLVNDQARYLRAAGTGALVGAREPHDDLVRRLEALGQDDLVARIVSVAGTVPEVPPPTLAPVPTTASGS